MNNNNKKHYMFSEFGEHFKPNSKKHFYTACIPPIGILERVEEESYQEDESLQKAEMSPHGSSLDRLCEAVRFRIFC